jgi:hypothetical protein
LAARDERRRRKWEISLWNGALYRYLHEFRSSRVRRVEVGLIVHHIGVSVLNVEGLGLVVDG